MKKTNVRKTAAIGLAFVGLAGVGIASAATLDLNGGDSSRVQAGVDDLTYSTCQATTIDVNYSVDDGNGNGAGSLISDTGNVLDFGYVHEYDVLSLDSFDAACGGKNFEVALGGTNGELIGEASGVVPTGGGVVTLGAGAWTFTGSSATLSKVAVTVYD